MYITYNYISNTDNKFSKGQYWILADGHCAKHNVMHISFAWLTQSDQGVGLQAADIRFDNCAFFNY